MAAAATAGLAVMVVLGAYPVKFGNPALPLHKLTGWSASANEGAQSAGTDRGAHEAAGIHLGRRC